LVDAIHGKARRKLYARILDRLAGMELGLDTEAIDVGPAVPIEDQTRRRRRTYPMRGPRAGPAGALDEYRDLVRNTETVKGLRNLQSVARGDQTLTEEDRVKVSDAFGRRPSGSAASRSAAEHRGR